MSRTMALVTAVGLIMCTYFSCAYDIHGRVDDQLHIDDSQVSVHLLCPLVNGKEEKGRFMHRQCGPSARVRPN